SGRQFLAGQLVGVDKIEPKRPRNAAQNISILGLRSQQFQFAAHLYVDWRQRGSFRSKPAPDGESHDQQENGPGQKPAMMLLPERRRDFTRGRIQCQLLLAGIEVGLGERGLEDEQGHRNNEATGFAPRPSYLRLRASISHPLPLLRRISKKL